MRSNDDVTSTTESSQPLSLGSTVSKYSAPSTPVFSHVSVFDGLGDQEKETQLVDMFTSLKPIDVKLALKKAKGDASLAIDELLNIEWLEQAGQRPKGVDAFFSLENSAPSKKRKGKNKKTALRVTKANRSSSSNVSEDLDETKEVDDREFSHLILRTVPPPQVTD